MLSVLVICVAIIAALTLFFRVNQIEVTGQQRYTTEQGQEASEIQIGDNLILLNKYDAAGSIVETLPYVEDTRINRKLPSTLVIEVTECGTPVAVVQDGYTWLISSRGKIVDQLDLGGYIPCPDHRIAPDAKWENVQYYCEKFRKVFG